MDRNFLNSSLPTISAFAACALLLAAPGCGRGPAEDGGAGAPAATNVSEVAVKPATLTPEEKEAEKMRDLLDDGQEQAAIRLARNLMDSEDRKIRSQVLETLAWIGRRAIPEITEMINDADPDIAEEALSAWEQAFSEVGGEHRQAAVIAETLPKLRKPDPVNAILHHATEMDERTAMQMLAGIIDSNATNFVGECARDMYRHVSGGEIYAP